MMLPAQPMNFQKCQSMPMSRVLPTTCANNSMSRIKPYAFERHKHPCGSARTRRPAKKELCLAFGFAEAGDAVTGFPLAALFEEFDALEALEDIAFCASGAGGSEAAMLRHKNLLIWCNSSGNTRPAKFACLVTQARTECQWFLG